jgi:hypothetical protein
VVRQIGTVAGVAGLVMFLARYNGDQISDGYRAGWWLCIAATGLTFSLCLFVARRLKRH